MASGVPDADDREVREEMERRIAADEVRRQLRRREQQDRISELLERERAEQKTDLILKARALECQARKLRKRAKDL